MDESGWKLWLSNGVACVVFGLVTSILLLYVLHFSRADFSSDDAVVNLLAQSMFDQGRLLPAGWVNNNGDLMVPSGALLVAPLLRWIPNGFEAHSVAGVFAVVTLLSAFAWLLRILSMPWTIVLALSAFVASGISHSLAYFVFAQTTYFWWPVGFIVGACLILKIKLEPPVTKLRYLLPFLLFALVFLISFANPGRVLLMMVVPLALLERTLPQKQANGANSSILRGWRRWIGRDNVPAFSIGVGFLLAVFTYLTLRYVGVTDNVNGAAALVFGDWDGVRRHWALFERGWPLYLGAERGVNYSVPWLVNALYLFQIGIALGLTWVAISESLRVLRPRDAIRRALAIAFVGAFVPIFAMYLVFDSLSLGAGSLRYFTVPIFILVSLAAFQLRDLVRRFPNIARSALPIFGLLLVPVALKNYLPSVSTDMGSIWESGRSHARPLADALRREGLRWGYASWWNAGLTTVMSDSEVRVNPVALSSSGVAPTPAMMLRDWYRSERWSGETFLALAQGEASADKLELLDARLGTPTRALSAANYRILVYDHNIADDFDCSSSISMNVPIAPGQPTARLVAARFASREDLHRHMAIVQLRNDGTAPVGGAGRYPMSIGVQLLDESGALVKPDWLHSLLPCTLEPGSEREFKFVLPQAPAGRWIARFDLVQEGVAWFQNRGMRPIDLQLQEIARPLPKLDFESRP